MKKPLELFLPLLLLPALSLHAAGIPITGRVLTPEGRPAPGVRALLLPGLPAFELARMELAGKAGPEPVATASTGEDGGFRLTAPDAGMWVVRLESAGAVPLEQPLLPLVEAAELADARLVPDAGLQVRVADPQGKPAANAWVRVEGGEAGPTAAEPWQAPLRRVAFTDAQGAATLPRARNETLSVWAGVPGSLAAQERVHGSAVSLRLGAGTARGIEVRDAQGKPVAGALAAFRESAWVAGRTAEAGRLDLAVLPAGADLRLATEDGRRLDYRLRAARPDEKGPAMITLPPLAPAGGRVTTAAGKPLAGALVWPDRDLGPPVRAGRDGAFRLAHLPEEIRVFATAPGFFSESARGTRGQVPALVLQPRLKAGGVVVDEAGHPVAGAGLRATPSFLAQGARNPAAWRSGGFARSAASGRFQLTALAVGMSYELGVVREGFAPAREVIPARAAGAPAPELRIVLHPGRTASGLVIDGAHRPVAGAEVALLQAAAGDPLARLREARSRPHPPAAATDAAGRFEIKTLPPGTFDLTVRARGFAPLTVPGLAIPAGKGVTDLGTVQLAPGSSIHGVVADSQGEPVADAEVRARSGGRNGPALFPGEGEERDSVLTAADGSFVFEDLAPGVPLDLVATHPGYAPGAAPGVAVPAPAPVRIVLALSSRVSGRATGPDGKPVAGASVTLNESNRRFSSALWEAAARHQHRGVTDDEGRFSFVDVSPGAFELSADAPRHQEAVLRGLEVKPGQDLAGVEIVLPAGAAVEGRVSSPEGRPVEDAEVMVAEPSRRGSPFSSLRDGTDAEGRYRIEGISPGPHTLEVRAEGYKRAVRDVELKDEAHGVDFQLERGPGEVSGRVVDDAGAPVAGAGVVLFASSGALDVSRSAESGADGSFLISGVNDGSYRLHAAKNGYAPARAENEVTVAGGPVSGLELKLSAAEGTIAGRLIGLEFSQLSRVGVWTDSGGTFGGVDAEGSYKILHLPPGTVKVSAAVPDTPLRAEGRVTLEPGAAEARLDLTFGNGHELSGVVLRNGEPLVDAGVLLVKAGGAARQRAATDHQGGFRFGGLEDGSYQLSVVTPNGAWHQETVEISGDQTIRVELRTASLSGRVVDAADSSPVPGAAIVLKRTDGVRPTFLADATTDARGAFHLPEVGEGSWTVQASLEGYATAERAVLVEGDSPPGDIEIRLEPTEGVTVEALLPSGQPPDRLRVAALDGAGNAVSVRYYPTGENGRTRISNVPPGSWLLLVEASPAGPATVPVAVPGPAVQVVLPPAGGVRIQVPELEQNPSPAVAVLSGAGGPYRGFDDDGAVRAEWALSSGARSLDQVPAGVWRIAVRAADGRSWSATATVTPGGVAVVEPR
jgi:protocatechuate 3,4-dioxygenase beta subunit